MVTTIVYLVSELTARLLNVRSSLTTCYCLIVIPLRFDAVHRERDCDVMTGETLADDVLRRRSVLSLPRIYRCTSVPGAAVYVRF